VIDHAGWLLTVAEMLLMSQLPELSENGSTKLVPTSVSTTVFPASDPVVGIQVNETESIPPPGVIVPSLPNLSAYTSVSASALVAAAAVKVAMSYFPFIATLAASPTAAQPTG
jgi:hypothetical protein